MKSLYRTILLVASKGELLVVQAPLRIFLEKQHRVLSFTRDIWPHDTKNHVFLTQKLIWRPELIARVRFTPKKGL